MSADHNNNQISFGAKQTKMSAIKTNNSVYIESKAEKNYCARYRSGSSSDSAITLDNNSDNNWNNSNVHLRHKESADIYQDLTNLIYNFGCLMSQNQIAVNSAPTRRILDIAKKYQTIQLSHQSYDEFGFVATEDSDSDQSHIEQLISQLLDSNAAKQWTESCESIKCLIRQLGIPNAMRARVWLLFIRSKVDDTYDIEGILDKVENPSQHDSNVTSLNSDILNQIELDICRTFPSHRMFKGAEGISKLRNVLIGYCVHINSSVGYCQGMNFIAALLLIVFDGDQHLALMGLISIIEHYFPPHYYDQHLTGARADQMLLRQLIADLVSNARPDIHLNEQMLDELTTALSLNWFLSLFHSSLPFQIRLYVIDCFWLEGVKVLFRFSLALIKMTIEESNAEEVQNSGELISAIREKTKRCYDLIELKRIAFNEIKLPKRKYMATKRCFYVRQITSQFSPTPIHKTESSSQWFRRKSAEMFGFNTSEHKIVVSSDRSKIAILRKTYRSLNEISILSANNSESVLKTFWSLKDAVIIGVTNDGKRLVFSHFSSKTMSKVKNDIKIDLIGVNFDVFDGFYLEESDSAIMICSSGLVSKCKVSKRQFETIMIMNDKNLNVVSSHLNVDYGLVWLDSVSQKNSHTFIAFDVDNLDVFTIIQTDLFTIDRFIANPCDTESVIVVKTEPINGKLRKVIDILSDDFQEKRQSQPLEDVLDIHSLSLSADSELSDSECLIVLITRNSFDIYIEYKYRNLWMKRKLLVSDCESCPLKTIKIIGVSTEDSIWKVTVLVVDNSTHTIQLDIGPGQH